MPPESRYEYITNETSGEGTLYELPRPATPFPDMTPYPDGILEYAELSSESLLLADDSSPSGNDTT